MDDDMAPFRVFEKVGRHLTSVGGAWRKGNAELHVNGAVRFQGHLAPSQAINTHAIKSSSGISSVRSLSEELFAAVLG